MGLMGSGKTKLGKLLAPKLNLPFIDLDERIEQAEQMTIADIFKVHGEAHFRLLEHRHLHSLANWQPHVVSLGGGTPCSEHNIAFIKASGLSVYLKVPVAILASRLENKANERPLLHHKSPEELKQFLEEQLSKRAAFYEQANLIVPNDGKLSGKKLASLIKEVLG